MVQLSHPYMTTGKTIALTRRTFVGKVVCRGFEKPSPGGFSVSLTFVTYKQQSTLAPWAGCVPHHFPPSILGKIRNL